jgi:hypothetical protein
VRHMRTVGFATVCHARKALRLQGIASAWVRVLAQATVIVPWLLFAPLAKPVLATIFTTDTDSGGVNATALVDNLLGGGVSATNVTYTGAPQGAGIFTGGGGILGGGIAEFESGVILSSGDIASIVGPNVAEDTQTSFFGPGDADLDGLIPEGATFDAAVLEFDFVPTAPKLTFQYVFASDEYNEFVDSSFNDVFGFFVNGVNLAVVPDTQTAVSINNISPNTNPLFYENNACADTGCPLDIEADGLTVALSFTAPVNPGQTNHIKLAIADVEDDIYDSWVFIRQGTFASTTAEVTVVPRRTKLNLVCSIDDKAKNAGSCEAIGFALTADTSVGASHLPTLRQERIPVTKRATKKFKKGRAKLKLQLNRVGKGLLKQSGQLTVVTQTTVTDRDGRQTTLQNLVDFVKKNKK